MLSSTAVIAASIVMAIALAFGDAANFIPNETYLTSAQISACIASGGIFLALVIKDGRLSKGLFSRLMDALALAALGGAVFYFLCFGALPAAWTALNGEDLQVQALGVVEKDRRAVLVCKYIIRVSEISNQLERTKICISENLFNTVKDNQTTQFVLKGKGSGIGFKVGYIIAR